MCIESGSWFGAQRRKIKSVFDDLTSAAYDVGVVAAAACTADAHAQTHSRVAHAIAHRIYIVFPGGGVV